MYKPIINNTWRFIMNRKILAILVVFIAAVSIASVCADELTKEQDFDGKFKMNINETSNFVKVVDGVGTSALLSDQSWSDNKTALVCYYDKPIDNVVSELKSNSGYMDDPTTDGNLTILEYPDYGEGSTEEYAFHYFVGVSSPENSTVFIASNDLDLAKEYANTIKFA